MVLVVRLPVRDLAGGPDIDGVRDHRAARASGVRPEADPPPDPAAESRRATGGVMPADAGLCQEKLLSDSDRTGSIG